MGEAPPLGVVCEQRRERLRVALVERCRRRTKLVDHGRSMAGGYPRPVAGSSTVELLYFEGCPNYERARELVLQAAAYAGVEIELRLTEVTSPAEAERLRFLGSPSVRVNGRDVEPGADEREAFVLGCRVYRTGVSVGGHPAEEWIRAALAG